MRKPSARRRNCLYKLHKSFSNLSTFPYLLLQPIKASINLIILTNQFRCRKCAESGEYSAIPESSGNVSSNYFEEIKSTLTKVFNAILSSRIGSGLPFYLSSPKQSNLLSTMTFDSSRRSRFSLFLIAIFPYRTSKPSVYILKDLP